MRHEGFVQSLSTDAMEICFNDKDNSILDEVPGFNGGYGVGELGAGGDEWIMAVIGVSSTTFYVVLRLCREAVRD